MLLSNGAENRAPFAEDVLPDIIQSGVVVHTVGLGAGANIELLEHTARQTGGKFRFAPAPAELLEIYNDILATLTGRQRLLAETATIGPGSSQLIPVPVGALSPQVLFLITWENPGIGLGLELQPPLYPLKPVIDSSTVHPDVRFASGPTYQFFQIWNPIQFGIGDWLMRITSSSWTTTHAVQQNEEPFTASASADSALEMVAQTNKESYLTSEPIFVGATLDDPLPITGATVTATIQTPSGTSQIQLFDDGTHGDDQADDGTYVNFFSDTSAEGVYEISTEAAGTSNNGEPFARLAELSMLVEPHPAPPADLFIQKSGPAEIVAGSELVYTITYGNNGPQTATSVLISDVPPSDTTYISDTFGTTQKFLGESINWSVGGPSSRFSRLR